MTTTRDEARAALAEYDATRSTLRTERANAKRLADALRALLDETEPTPDTIPYETDEGVVVAVDEDLANMAMFLECKPSDLWKQAELAGQYLAWATSAEVNEEQAIDFRRTFGRVELGAAVLFGEYADLSTPTPVLSIEGNIMDNIDCSAEYLRALAADLIAAADAIDQTSSSTS